MSEQEIDVFKSGSLGRIVLNRPKTLNAATFSMISAVARALDEWEGDDSVRAVLIEGAGDKAFCAGGDVVAVSQAGKEQSELSRTFFQSEYRLNRRIHGYPKPYVALIDGIVMGGGVGLSVHGSHRIATERTMFAMPETGIGLFPDVGGSYFLPRCPGRMGEYLGLTGARLNGAEMAALGLSDGYIQSVDTARLIDGLQDALADGSALAADTVTQVVNAMASDAGDAPILAHQGLIDAAFSKPTVEEIQAHLEQDGSDFAAKTLATLRQKSPTLLKAALVQIRRGRDQTFDKNMVMEYRMVRHALRPAGDFHEGVRALLIDKDKSPHWNPDNLEAVTDDMITDFFREPPEGDLTF